MSDKNEKAKVFYSIEEDNLNILKEKAKKDGPAVARIVENEILEFLKDKKLKPEETKSTNKQVCFYLEEKQNELLENVAKAEGRSVSNLVAWIIKKKILKSKKV